jgi:hypothetical protein
VRPGAAALEMRAVAAPNAADHDILDSMELVAIRRVILFVLLLGMVGLLAELSLLGHYEDIKQWIPIFLLALGLLAVGLDLIFPRPSTLRLLQGAMMLFVVSGFLGMYFHYQGSREFQLEMDPSMSGMNLMWEVLQAKSPPTLSPGTMVQMGVLGLGYAYLRRAK